MQVLNLYLLVDTGFSPISAASINGHPIFETPGGLASYGLRTYTTNEIPVPQNQTSSHVSKLRLFVVVHKVHILILYPFLSWFSPC